MFPEVLYHRTFLEQNMTSYKLRIATGEFGLIWLTMPQNNGRAVPRNKLKTLMKFYNTILSEARMSNILAVLTGIRNTLWMDEHLVSLCQDGKVECHKHALCRLDLSLQVLSKDNYRSGVVFNAITTFKSDPTPCNCNDSIKHIDDRVNETGEGSRFTREAVNRDVYIKLMNIWFRESGFPRIVAASASTSRSNRDALTDDDPVIRSSPIQMVEQLDKGKTARRHNQRKKGHV